MYSTVQIVCTVPTGT